VITLENYTTANQDIFDDSTGAYADLKALIEVELLRLARITDPSVVNIVITGFRQGSLIVDSVMQVDNTASANPSGTASNVANDIAAATSLTVDGETYTVPSGNVLLSGVAVNSTSSTDCVLHELLPPPESCSSQGKQCEVISGTAACTDIPTTASTTTTAASSTDDNKELVIGLAVGVPLFFLFTLLIAIIVYMYVRSQRRASERSSNRSQGREAPFQSVFATQMATKGSWGAPSRLYSPDAYSEAATSDSSGDGHLLKSRNKGRSDFQDSPWYDNRGGATPRGATTSRGAPTEAPTEAAGPTSNFSWEYMFRMLEPHSGLEIPRPNASASPNPMFTPRRSNKPDSMA